MIDVQGAYNDLTPEEQRHARDGGRSHAPSQFWRNFRERCDHIEGLTKRGGRFKDREDSDGVPQAWPSNVKFSGEVPTKITIKASGRVSNTTYQKTLWLSDGKLDSEDFQNAIDNLRSRVWEKERGARMETEVNGKVQERVRELLSEAFGEENVGGNWSKSAPVKVDVKKDGSVRLQITDLSKGAAVRVAEVLADENLDLDLDG